MRNRALPVSNERGENREGPEARGCGKGIIWQLCCGRDLLSHCRFKQTVNSRGLGRRTGKTDYLMWRSLTKLCQPPVKRMAF